MLKTKWPALALLLALGLLAGVVTADISNSTGKLGPVLGGSGGGTSFTGGVLSTGSSINNDLCFTFGTTDTTASPCIRYDTTQTVDTGMLLTGTVSNHWVLAERQDETFDFSHAQTTDPTLFIHSHNQSTTQYLGMRHDGTDAVFLNGTGHMRFNIAASGQFIITTINARPLTLVGTDGFGGISISGASNGIESATTASLIRLSTAASASTTGLQFMATNNVVQITELADVSFAFNHAAATTPTLFIHSQNQNTTQWIGITHNAAHGTISTGLGPVALAPGANVASAAAMPLPTGNVFHVTGTTNITSITSTSFTGGMCIALIFDDVLTFTDGNNLKLAGNFTTSADDTISLCYDGTNWYETARAVN